MSFCFCFVSGLLLTGIGLLLALEGELPLLAAGPWEDPALGDDVAELGGVHEAHHAVAGNEGGAIGVRPGPLEPLHRDGPVARAEGRALRLVAMEQSHEGEDERPQGRHAFIWGAEESAGKGRCSSRRSAAETKMQV